MIKSEDRGIVYRKKVIYEPVSIPEGHVVCPTCDGSGEVRFQYSDFPPDPRGDFMPCYSCLGRGYVREDTAEGIKQRAKEGLFFYD